MLAWTLALLIAPAIASACDPGTATYTGASLGNWSDGANWSTATPPTLNQVVCIPSPKVVVVDLTTAEAGSLTVESGAGVTIAGAQQLTIGGGTIGLNSTISGVMSVDGNLEMKQNVELDSPGSMDIGGSAIVDANASFTINNGLDITGGGTLQYDGLLVAAGGTAVDPVQISAKLMGGGVFSNGGFDPSPVVLTGGSGDSGTWKLGSGTSPEPTWTLGGGAFFTHDGPITDVDGGSLGHLIVGGGAALGHTAAGADIDVYKFDLNAGSSTDFTGSATVSIQYASISPGAGNLFEVAQTMHAHDLRQTDGEMLLASQKDWTIGTFHWEGGTISASSAHSGLLTVTDGLDMTGSGARATANADLTVLGNGGETSPYTAGTFTLNTSVLTIGPGVHFVIGADVDMAGNPTDVVDNQGIVDKQGGSATTGSHIQPLLQTASGELWVSAGQALILDQLPDTFDNVTNTLTGNYILDGELVIPGTINSFAGQWQLGAGGTITQTLGGTDVFSTLAENGPNSTITVFNPISFANNFTNRGTVDVKAGGQFQVTAGKTYTQLAGATTKLSDPGSQLAAPVDIQGGTLSGVGQVIGDVTNNGGTVSPGNSPGTLTINGNFTQNGSGVYQEEIDGPAAGQFDKLAVFGTATLGGTIVLASTNGYQAPDTQQFQIIDATGGIAGTWGNVAQPPASPYFEQVYAANTMVLIANSVSIGDVSANEGTDAAFTISLGQASASTVSVDWATQDGTATAGSDYTAGSGTVTFAPGETSKTVAVPITADGKDEPAENFAVNLSNPVNTRIRDANGVGTIGATATPAQVQVVPPGDIDGFPTPPPPIQGRAVNVEPVKGTVLVKLPGATKFVPLPDAEQVPVGTIVDARKGTVRLFSVGKGGRVQFADFYEGVFKVQQKVGQALTTLVLTGGSFAGCPKTSRATAAAKRKKNSSVRHLWGSGSGQFRTAGRYASATIRGTKWLTDDRCNGTLIRVAVGSVTVRDLTLKKSIVVKKPKSYLAPAVKPKKRR